MIQRWRRDDSSPQSRPGILLAIGGNTADQVALRTTALAAAKSGKHAVPVYAVHVIEMPWTEAVDAPPDDEALQQADEALEHARMEAEQIGCRLEVEILQARTAGAAIVDEATERNCGLIVLGLPYRELHGSFNMGNTVPYVLGHAGMQVWVVREPGP